MAASINLLLDAENLQDSLPMTDATSLYKVFQSLFLVECPTDDPKILQNIQLTAAFLEYLSTQRVSRLRELLRAWQEHVASTKLEETDKEVKEGREGGEKEVEIEEGKEEGEKNDSFSMKDVLEEKTSLLTDEKTLDEIMIYIQVAVNDVCVYFEGQDVDAVVRLEEVKSKVAGILSQSATWFWPKFICKPMEAV